jgi:hypothetical protein
MVPDVLRPYLDELVGRTRAVLGGDLLGIYAAGSVALDAYEHGRSDVDVAAVTHVSVARETRRRLVEALRHEALPCPARVLEFVLYPASATRRPTAGAGLDLNLNTGSLTALHASFDAADEHAHWFVIDRSILGKRGVALTGPPAAEVFAPLPPAVVLAALAAGLRWHAESTIPRPDDAVLNACRSLRYLADATWTSKREAGQWALAHLEERPLVRAALAARTDAAELAPAEVSAFLGRTLAAAEAAAAQAASSPAPEGRSARR